LAEREEQLTTTTSNFPKNSTSKLDKSPEAKTERDKPKQDVKNFKKRKKERNNAGEENKLTRTG
jgi:hypothetical protein